MCGKGGGGTTTTNQTSTTTIPPEVLAQYNKLTAGTWDLIGQHPDFQPWNGGFVAPVDNTFWQGAGQAAGSSNWLNDTYAPTAFNYLQSGIQSAQPYLTASAGYYGAAPGAVSPYLSQASNYFQGGINAMQPYFDQAGSAAQTGLGQAASMVGQASAQGQNAINTAMPYFTQGAGAFNQAVPAASPYLTAASQGYGSALSTGMAGLGAAAGYLPAGTAAVNPDELNIAKYESPYQRDVIDATMARLRQQQGMELAQQQSGQVLGGFFGGDRANTDRSVLQGQQDLSSGQVLSGLNQANYAQALAAAMQQQGVNLGAAEANRGAQQWGEGAQAALAQAGYGMGANTAAGYAGIGNTLGNLYLGTGQGLAGIGQGVGNLGMSYANILNQGGLGLGQLGLGAGNLYAGMGSSLANAYGAAGQGALGAGGLALNSYLGAGQGLGQVGAQQYGMYGNAAQNALGIGSAQAASNLASGQATTAIGQYLQGLQQQGLQSNINQYMAQQAYPFQLNQYLANIIQGTGSLYPTSTNTTGSQTAPQPFFSDRRLKENIEKVGETDSGIPIHKFNYKGQPGPQIGLIAQEVEKKRPEAVGSFGGLKTVDYDAATRPERAEGGLVPTSLGGAVDETRAGMGFAAGGGVDPEMLKLLRAMQAGGLGGADPRATAAFPGGGAGLNLSGGPRGIALSPPAGHPPQAVRPPPMPQPQQQPNAMKSVADAVSMGKNMAGLYTGGKDVLVGSPAVGNTPASGGLLGTGGSWDPSGGQISKGWDWLSNTLGFADGGRVAFADGGGSFGDVMPYAGYGYTLDMGKPEFTPDELRQREQRMVTAPPPINKTGPSGSAGGGGGKALGSLAGGIAGSFIPIPGGTFIGSALGGLLGGMFNAGGRVGKEGGGGLGDVDPLAAALDTPIETDIDPLTGKYRDTLPEARPTPIQAGIPGVSRGLNVPVPAPAPTEPPQGGLVPVLPEKVIGSGPAVRGVEQRPSSDADELIRRAAHATKAVESSGGNYGIVGPETTYKDGRKDKPYGAYQVMGANIPQWTKEALGTSMTPEEFLKSQEAQDAVFNHRARQHLNKYGSMDQFPNEWFTGTVNPNNKSDVLGTTPQTYQQKWMTAFQGNQPPPTSPAPSSTAVVAPDQSTASAPGNLGALGDLLKNMQGSPQKDPTTGTWLDRYERPIASGLAFLGGMLSSPSHQLAGSIGHGLTAAASAYPAMGYKNQEIAQNQQRLQIGTISQANDMLTKLRSIAAAQAGAPGGTINPQVLAQIDTLTKFLLGSNSTGAPAAGGATGPAAPVGAPVTSPVTGASATGRPAPVQEVPVSKRLPPQTPASWWDQVDDDWNPTKLNQQAAVVAAQGQDSSYLRNKATEAANRLASTGGLPGKGGGEVKDPTAAERTAYEVRKAENPQWAIKQEPIYAQRQNIRSNVNQIVKIVEGYQTGKLNDYLGEVQALANAAGMKVPDTANMSAANLQSFLKDASAVIAGSNTGDVNTDAARALLQRAFAAPTLEPGATKKILSQALGNLDYADQYYKHTLENMKEAPGLNRQQLMQEWDPNAADPEKGRLGQLTKENYDRLAVRGATPDPREMQKNPEKYLNNVFVIEPRELSKYGIAPGKYGPKDKPVRVKMVRQSDGQIGWDNP